MARASAVLTSLRHTAVAAVAVLLFLVSLCSAADYTVGVILPGDVPYYREIQGAFVSGLNREGLGGRVDLLVQKPFPDPISLSNAARKLIALDVDVIVTYGASATIAALAEKSRIPVIYAAVYEPLAQKIRTVNSSGTTLKVSISSLVRYLRGMTTLGVLGVVYSSGEDDSVYQMRELLKLSQQYGFRIEAVDLRRPQDAKMVLAGKRFDALFITGGAVAALALPATIDFAREMKIPTAALIPDDAAKTTITLSARPRDFGEKTADIVAKVLGGTNPERMKAGFSAETELVFNLKEAKTLGFKIPMDLVTGATRLIQ